MNAAIDLPPGLPGSALATLLAGALAEAGITQLVIEPPPAEQGEPSGGHPAPADTVVARETDLPALLVAAPHGTRVVCSRAVITTTPTGCIVATDDQPLIDALMRTCR